MKMDKRKLAAWLPCLADALVLVDEGAAAAEKKRPGWGRGWSPETGMDWLDAVTRLSHYPFR